MKSIKIKKDYPIRYMDDCLRIQRILASKGYSASLNQCQELWEVHSDTYAAGWLFLPKEDEVLFSDVRNYIEEDD